MKFKQVQLSPMRIPPQQEAARELVARMRKPFPVATWLNELIRKAQPRASQGASGSPKEPPPEPVLAVEELIE